MVTHLNQIRDFAEHWKLPLAQFPTFSAEAILAYQKFFHEELQTELAEAAGKETERERLTHTTDCLIDAMVFIFQLANQLGIGSVMQLAWDEVHRSNSTKGNYETGELADSNGKWIKGSGYSRPNLSVLFQNSVTVAFQPGHTLVAGKLALLVKSKFPTVDVNLEETTLTLADQNQDSTFLVPFLVSEIRSFGMRLKSSPTSSSANTSPSFSLEEDVTIAKLDSYQGWVKRVARYPSGLVYTTAGLASEAGEVLGVVQKVMRRLNSSQVDASDLGNKAKARLLDELSDILFYLVATANELGITVEHLVEVNREKIETRISNGTVYATN